MKKIMMAQIKGASGSYSECYELQEESFECEYSEEWFIDSDDPIKDYVNNMLEETVGDIENYGWDLAGNECVYFTKYTNDSNIEHVLYYKGKPTALYWVVDM